MAGYLVNFSIYTLAMVGIIFTALYIFKTVVGGRSFSKKSSFLNVEESMNLSARKNLYVIKAGTERFLIAGDVDKTSLIAKLESNSPAVPQKQWEDRIEDRREDKSSELSCFDGIEALSEFSIGEDFASVIDFKKNSTKAPMMRELARKLSAM